VLQKEKDVRKKACPCPQQEETQNSTTEEKKLARRKKNDARRRKQTFLRQGTWSPRRRPLSRQLDISCRVRAERGRKRRYVAFKR